MKIKKNPFCSRNYYKWVAFWAAISSIYTIFTHHFRRQHHSNCNNSSENWVLTRYAFNLKRTKPITVKSHSKFYKTKPIIHFERQINPIHVVDEPNQNK